MSARSSSPRRETPSRRLRAVLAGAGPRRWCASLLLALCALALLASPAAAKTKARPSDRELVDVYAAVEGAMLGEVLPGGPEKFIEVVDSPKWSEAVEEYGKRIEAGAVTDLTWNEAGTEAIHARITVFRGERSGSEARIRGTVAHEVFHVFEARLSGDRDINDGHAGWLQEGAAGWVESDLVRNDPSAGDFWEGYLKTPETELFSRLYSAIGFFGHMASSGINPWRRFKSIFTAPSSEAAYDAAVGGSTSFLESQASAFFREPSRGAEWNQTGANVPSAAAVGYRPTKVTVGKKPVLLTVPAYADGAYSVSIAGLPPDASLVEVVVHVGHVHLLATAGGDLNAVNPTRLLLCSASGGCHCPTQPTGAKEFQRGNLAIAGGTEGAVVRIAWLGRCEKLRPASSCTTLLPGFTTELESKLRETLEGADREGLVPTGEGAYAGLPFAQTRSMGGSSASTCAFLYKGTFSSNEEGEAYFSGLIAPFASLISAPNVGAAKIAFGVLAKVIGGEHPSGIGEEAILTTSEGGSLGAATYGTTGAVRVKNLIAYYGVYSTPGNVELAGGQAKSLLRAVAAKL